jgi:hypothetical protein
VCNLFFLVDGLRDRNYSYDEYPDYDDMTVIDVLELICNKQQERLELITSLLEKISGDHDQAYQTAINHPIYKTYILKNELPVGVTTEEELVEWIEGYKKVQLQPKKLKTKLISKKQIIEKINMLEKKRRFEWE